MEGDIRRIPLFIKANTPAQLQTKMLATNVEFGIQFEYDIMFNNKTWYAWYLPPVRDDELDALTAPTGGVND